MAPNFQWLKSLTGASAVIRNHEMEPSLSLIDGMLLEFAATSKVQQISNVANLPIGVCAGNADSTANGGESTKVLDIGLDDSIWKCYITPKLNGVVALAGGSTSTIKVPSDAAYNANDWKGGYVYIKEMGLVAKITASDNPSGAAQPMTFTITSALKPHSISGESDLFPASGALLPSAPDGMTIYATPLGQTIAAAKLTSDFKTISQLIADKTGGHAQILEVHLEARTNPYLVVFFHR